MTIESGTTKDRRNRIIIFLVMCIFFSVWFARDGFYSYPTKNLQWARQSLQRVENLPEPKDLRTNPKALKKNLDRVKPGMNLAKVEALLGEPTFKEGENYCYIGPASYGWFKIIADKVSSVEQVQENIEPSESDVNNQRYLACIMAVLFVLTLIHLLRVMAMRVVLDDTGLAIRGKKIAFDDMIGLAANDYERKGWLDLKYRAGDSEASVRLDNYHIERFDEIVRTICEKKHFVSPLKSPEAKEED